MNILTFISFRSWEAALEDFFTIVICQDLAWRYGATALLFLSSGEMLVLGRHCGEDGVVHLADRSCGKLPMTNVSIHINTKAALRS